MARITRAPWNIETVERAIPLGTRLVYRRDSQIGVSATAGAPVAWVSAGADGEVVDHIAGYPEHACPDHHHGAGCVCGDESGRVSECEAVAVVAWRTAYEDGSEGPRLRRCVRLSERGQSWSRAKRDPARRGLND